MGDIWGERDQPLQPWWWQKPQLSVEENTPPLDFFSPDLPLRRQIAKCWLWRPLINISRVLNRVLYYDAGMLSRRRCSLGCRVGLVAGLLPFMAGVGTLPQRNLSPIIPFSCKERKNIILERQIQKDDQYFGNDDDVSLRLLLSLPCRIFGKTNFLLPWSCSICAQRWGVITIPTNTSGSLRAHSEDIN